MSFIIIIIIIIIIINIIIIIIIIIYLAFFWLLFFLEGKVLGCTLTSLPCVYKEEWLSKETVILFLWHVAVACWNTIFGDAWCLKLPLMERCLV